MCKIVWFFLFLVNVIFALDALTLISVCKNMFVHLTMQADIFFKDNFSNKNVSGIHFYSWADWDIVSSVLQHIAQ